MPKIVISGEAMDAMQRDSARPIKTSDCTQMSRGQWRIPIAAETLALLQQVQLKGETISDTIVRIIARRKGLN